MMGRKLRFGHRKNSEQKRQQAKREADAEKLPSPSLTVLQERIQDLLVLPQGFVVVLVANC